MKQRLSVLVGPLYRHLPGGNPFPYGGSTRLPVFNVVTAAPIHRCTHTLIQPIGHPFHGAGMGRGGWL
ncbi:hypothetical protein C5167_012207 [Papaver somniferum]|uniref:Uncharacterized protein n=1 Tax=Papaver somniferum TaxID=3469 RepID=A0A4Y7IZY6_PAPSO|nr:hypothetical protein C5167_012207 [Papaver somniferum]